MTTEFGSYRGHCCNMLQELRGLNNGRSSEEGKRREENGRNSRGERTMGERRMKSRGS